MFLEFGAFEFDPRTRELRRRGRRVPLAPQPSALLAALLERPGEIVLRDEMRRALWPDGSVVEYEAGIAAALRHVRAALGDDGKTPRFVETLPRRGYRFLAPVVRREPATVPTAARLPMSPPDGPRRPALWMGAAAVAALAIAAAALPRRIARRTSPRVAILPVRRAADARDLAPLADLAAESFTTGLALSGGGRVDVLSRLATAGFPERWRPADMRRLPADFVVDTSLRAIGERVRLHAKLARVDDLRILWIRDFDLPRESLASTLDATIGRAAASMASEIVRPASVDGVPPRDTPAYDKWLSGRLFLREGNPGHAVERLIESTALDGSRAGSHAALARSILVGIRIGVFPAPQGRRDAARAVKRALALDADLPATQAALGGLLWMRGRPRDAERRLRRALEGDPNDALARTWLAAALAAEGNRAEGECEALAALESDPVWEYILREIQFQGLTDIPT